MKEMNEKRRNWKINVSLAVVMLLMLPGSSMLIDNSIPAGEDISVVSIDNRTFAGITIYVDDSNTEGPWDGTIDYPYQYIQDGINAAIDGDTIIVNDGIYNENILVNKELTVKAASSPVIDGQGMFGPAINIQADNVILQGFIIKNFTATPTAYIGAILVEGNNTTINSNTIENITSAEANPAGIGIDVHAKDVQITNNTVRDVGSIGIRVRHDWNTPPTEGNNVLIENNTVYRTNNTGVLVTGYAKGITIRNNVVYDSLMPTPYNLFVHYGAENVTIEDNYIHNTYSNVVLAGCNNITISNNTIADTIADPSPGKNIYILSDYANWTGDVNLLSTNVDIINNNIMNGSYGIRITNAGATDPSQMASTTTINYNNIYDNTDYGVENMIEANVNAEYNYWGHISGPYHATTNPTGQGDNVSGWVDFCPWLDASYPGGNPTSNLPEISDVHATPASQIAGGYVNITCNVVDDLAVDTVKVNITGPAGYAPVNATMNEGVTYYHNSIYSAIGTYHYFIWANDTTGMTNTSSLYAFEIINQPPYTPSDPYPENGSTDISIDADLNWTGGDPDPGDTVYYDIFFGTDPDPPNIEMAYYSTTYNLDRLDYFTQYYWRINAFDNHGYSTTSPVWTFYTEDDNPPDIPSNPGPANESTDNNLFTYLNWTCSDPDPGDTVTYDVYFGTTNPPPMVSNNQSADTYDPGGLNISTTYYWKIRAWDDYGYSATGPTWIFYTRDDTHPDIPSNPSPANNSIDVLLDADLSWTCSDPDPGDTLTYNVFFGIDPDPPQVSSDQSTTNYDPGELDYDTQYYWRIEAQDNYGNSSNSPIWTFRTEVYVNDPPNRPDAPDGPSSGRCRKSYTFTTSTTDPDGDHIFYRFDWGDGTDSGWIGPYESGRIAAASHAWKIQGSYAIKVQARDEHGAVSEWSDPLPVTMPKNTLLSRYPLFSLLFKFLEQHPHMFPILQLLLGL